MNALISFFRSKDGLVAVGGLILLGVVSSYSDPYNPWINLLARVGNVCLFLYILWRAAGKKLFADLGARRSTIAQELESLAQRKLTAEQELIKLHERLAGLETERRAILEESRVQGESMKAVLLAEARAEADKIREQALRAADSEAKGALDGLREQMADEIMVAVESALHERLTAGAHAKLIDNALKRVVLN
ncbi:MAG: ATP synthase F0 subunit B [Bilophila sp.]